METALVSIGAQLPFDAVLVESTSGSSSSGTAPLLLAPHGGPHSAIPTSWIMSYAFLAALGFKVLHVNFRWSQQLSLHRHAFCDPLLQVSLLGCFALRGKTCLRASNSTVWLHSVTTAGLNRIRSQYHDVATRF
jgi:hypothetical protein